VEQLVQRGQYGGLLLLQVEDDLWGGVGRQGTCVSGAVRDVGVEGAVQADA
jgi:hypothetical protein